MKKTIVVITILFCIIGIYLNTVKCESIIQVPGFTIDSDKSKDYQTLFIGSLLAQNMSDNMYMTDNLEAARAIYTQINVDSILTITGLTDTQKCWMKVDILLGNIVEVIFISEGIDFQRVLDNSVTVQQVDYNSNCIHFELNDHIYVIDGDEFVALFERIYTQRTTLIIKSPFDLDDFQDVELLIYDKNLNELPEMDGFCNILLRDKKTAASLSGSN